MGSFFLSSKLLVIQGSYFVRDATELHRSLDHHGDVFANLASGLALLFAFSLAIIIIKETAYMHTMDIPRRVF
jgi:hypothetical protein